MKILKTNKIIIFPAIIFAIACVLIGYNALCSTVTIKDAVLKADVATVFSKVSGEIKEFNLNKGSEVKEGEILTKIDTSDFENKLADAGKELDKIKKDYKNSEIKIDKINLSLKNFKESLKEAKQQLENANNDYVIYKNAYKDGSVTKNDMDKAVKNLSIAKSKLLAIENELTAANEQIKSETIEKNNKNLKINSLETKIEQEKANLVNATIISPVNGVIIKKNYETGEAIKLSEELLQIMPNNVQVVIPAKENIKKIKPEQMATISIDSKNTKIEGQILSIEQINKDGLNIINIITKDNISKFNLNLPANVTVKIKL